jgi:hypothetical protein
MDRNPAANKHWIAATFSGSTPASKSRTDDSSGRETKAPIKAVSGLLMVFTDLSSP